MAKRAPDIQVNGLTLDLTRPDDRAKLGELKAAAIRLRNFGTSISIIADRLGLDEHVAEHVLSEGLRELVADDAETVRARQQATLNDIRRAMYPAMAQGDQGAAGTILKVLDHEAKIHPGTIAPQRVHVGMDQETFTTTVDEDIRALGYHPRNDAPLEEGDGWANT